MKTPLLLFALASAGGLLAGCGSSDAGAGGDVPAAVTNELQGLSGAAKAAGGDYARLSEADRKRFVDRTGSEAGARAMVAQMAGGPVKVGGGAH